MPNSEKPLKGPSLRRAFTRLALFCAPLLVAAGALEWLFGAVPNAHTVKRTQLLARAAEIDTLIMGSSNAYFGVVPKKLHGSAYNLAYVSQTLFCDDQLLAQLTPRLPRLKRVIVVVGYISLYYQFKQGRLEGERQYDYQFEWGIPPRLAQDRLNLAMVSRLALAFNRGKLASQIREKLSYLRSHQPPGQLPGMDDRGWWTANLKSHDLGPVAAATTHARHRQGMNPGDFSENVALLEHLIAELRQKDIAVVLVTMPVWQTYAEGMSKDLWGNSVAAYESLALRFGARYLNFLQMPELGETDFLDPDHLNSQGAVRFSHQLNWALESKINPSPMQTL